MIYMNTCMINKCILHIYVYIYIYHITPIPTDIWGSGTNGSDIFSGPITGHMATMVSGLAPLEVRARSEVRAPVVTPS